MTPFLADKQKEFSLNFLHAQDIFHSDNWLSSFDEVFTNFQNLWLATFNFYLVSPFANILDDLDILNIFIRIYDDLTDLMKNLCWAVMSFAMTLTSLLIFDVKTAGKSFDQTLLCSSKVMLNTLDIALNMVLFVLSPIARVIATPIWYAQTPN